MTNSAGYTRFTNHQWFFARIGFTLHVIAGLPEGMDEATFRSLMRKTVARAPHLIQTESLEADGHRPAQADADSLSRYEVHDGPVPETADLRGEMLKPFADTGEPTFRARCHVSTEPNAQGFRTVFTLETSHAITEGSDFAALVRGQTPDRTRGAIPERPLSVAQRLGVRALAPVVALIYAAWAKLSRADPDDFVFADLAFDRASVRAAAGRLGVCQQALLFAMVLYALRVPERRGKRLWVGYSARPRVRPAGLDDEVFKFRFKDLFVRAEGSFSDFAQRVDDGLTRGEPDRLFAMALAYQMQGVNRRLFGVIPRLFSGNYFGFGPHDFMFSLAPPICPTGDMAALGEATIYAGAGPGAARGCLFVASKTAMTVSIRAERAVCDRVGALAELARSLGIVVR